MWTDTFADYFLRFAAAGCVPRRLFPTNVPSAAELPGRSGRLHIEIVSHCWKYSHLLRFQLSSLALFPPSRTAITMTVLHCPEDQSTCELLDFFAGRAVPNVTWNWLPLPKNLILRRAIGRNRAGLASRADWVFFCDCDQMFYHDALDRLCHQLQHRSDPLCFPRVVGCTHRLSDVSSVIESNHSEGERWLVEVDTGAFEPVAHTKAVGGLQIVHGDVVRQVGYCRSIGHYQKPTDRWQKTYEDRAFRWLLQTHGIPIEVPHIYRIEHQQKGRYERRKSPAWLRPLLSRAGRSDLLVKLRAASPGRNGS